MPWIRDDAGSDVEYHQQNTDFFCGPATAMMVLNTLGGDVGVQQADLYRDLHPNGTEWFTSPDGLAKGLDLWAPPAFRNRFKAKFANSEPEGTKLIIDALRAKEGPLPAALVYGKGHWVVVTNVKVSDPSDGNGGALAVEGLVLNIPSETPLRPRLNHADEDLCGSSIAFGSLNDQQYVSYEAWKRDFFTGYPAGDGRSTYAVVCADGGDESESDSESEPSPAIHASAGRIRSSGTFRAEALRAGARIVPDGAAEVVLQAVARHGLSSIVQDDAPSAVTSPEALFGLETGEPQVVSRLDVPGSQYYLVPLLKDGAQVALGRVDAQHGSFLGLSTSRGDEPALQTAQDLGGLLLPASAIASNLVWKPCKESRSPLEPFHQIIGPDGVTFRSLLGAEYAALTPLGAGG
jgi:hypothetical protein